MLPIADRDALLQALTEHLNYCVCSDDATLPLLRDFLRLVVERTDGVRDAERYRRACVGIEELLRANGTGAMRSWFIYALEQADLLFHGWNVNDLWITARGRWLLAGLEQFSEPATDEASATE